MVKYIYLKDICICSVIYTRRRNLRLPNLQMSSGSAIYRVKESTDVHQGDITIIILSLQWRHNEGNGVSNHQPRNCLLNRLLRRRSTKTSKLRVTGLCEGNSAVTGDFPAQRASNAETFSIWWRHHDDWNCHISSFLVCICNWDINFGPYHYWMPFIKSINVYPNSFFICSSCNLVFTE